MGRRTVQLKCSDALLVDMFQLGDAAIVSATVDERHVVTFQVDMPDAPPTAVAINPTLKSLPTKSRYDYYLSGIEWFLADGSKQNSTFDPPKEEQPDV